MKQNTIVLEDVHQSWKYMWYLTHILRHIDLIYLEKKNCLQLRKSIMDQKKDFFVSNRRWLKKQYQNKGISEFFNKERILAMNWAGHYWGCQTHSYPAILSVPAVSSCPLAAGGISRGVWLPTHQGPVVQLKFDPAVLVHSGCWKRAMRKPPEGLEKQH